MVGWGPFFEYIQWMVTSMPIMVGRLSLYLAEEVSLHAFMTPSTQSWELQDHILKDGWIYDMNSDFDMTLDGLRGIIIVSILEFLLVRTFPLEPNMF